MDKKHDIKKLYIIEQELTIIRKMDDFYICLLNSETTLPESIILSEAEVEWVKNILNCDGTEELNGKLVKTVLSIVQGSLMQCPHFYALGLDDSYVLLHTSKNETIRVLSQEELCQELNCSNVLDYTVKSDAKRKK